jgi:type II secretory pathway pseudopilin PulG
MRTAAVGRSVRGFTVVELLIAMAIMIGVTAAIFSLSDPSHGTYRTQPEVSDMQQRLRVGTSFITNALLVAGAGSPAGGRLTGSLMNFFAAIQPYRTGMIAPDPAAGIFYRDDAITIFYVPVGSPQTTISDPMPQPSSEVKVEPEPSCAGTSQPLSCKFKDGMRAIIFDDTGAWDDFTITQVQDSAGHMQHNKSIVGNTFSKAYNTGAQLAQILQRTFYWNEPMLQLMNYDGDQRDEVVADNVVALRFEYFGEPRPPVYITDPDGTRWTTYGPLPPMLGSSNGTTWPQSENCVFLLDGASGRQVSRLPDLAPGSSGLVPLTEAMLTDGPWCPDANFPTRFDADLLRIRKVGVRLRVQVASSQLRGPAGALFLRGGQASMGRNLVPDQDIRFEVTPRNFNLGR